MYKSILIPTDGSGFCERAVRQGIALAKSIGAKVVGVTVSQPLHTAIPRDLVPEHLVAIVEAEIVKSANERLAGLQQAAVAAGVAVETVRASHDHPWEAIVRTAKDKSCDLIVMASHGRRGVSSLILGSETQKVLTHTDLPVLVVR
ncbi:MAG: universal stress protein [Hyphomicrobiaceae bacterium]|nr:universal stress protein [Hyphomicrobiaceae bacterium]